MGLDIVYLLGLLAVIVLWFVFMKRPIYEAMLVGYVVVFFVILWGGTNLDKGLAAAQFWDFLIKPATNTLFYAIVGFLALAFVFGKTNVVLAIIDLILALVGRVRGGAGYVSLFGSTFMASLSGTGPGNVAATGVFTIPTMVKTKFPRALAATVEMSASSLGPIIPPSGTILLAFGVLNTLYPEKYSLSYFWMAVWGVGAYFILQRVITLYVFCRHYKVEPVPKEQLPKLGEVFKHQWPALLVPVIIFLPLYLDFEFGSTVIKDILGAKGAKAFSKSVILFAPGLATLYAIFISRKQIKGGASATNLFNLFKGGSRQVVPVAATVYFAYSISYLFKAAGVGEGLGHVMQDMQMNTWQLALVIPVFTCLLGMILPGSAQIAIFGGAIVTIMAAGGMDPLLAACILPAITGALEGMTPPLALAMFAAMGIADSGIGETSKLAFIWVFAHLFVAVLIMVGFLPNFLA
ncbi:TRAP transporter large permease subunit [Dethiosulfatarculus sandiegensis]|uniref:TRAP C4-dicarboxylate transport system permease DctM subunit domain-containing protein n=1 Tax=Dethiosulfatarculus sandiegensis TaxID=1429043 RepID=A0A0D2J6W3_9BACT|nr:TRAP transporter large permease subunit [Dethiosulfatarculus sandiegensis]KIX13914.1 hypothetical protein X474_12115 [Dethiosulfatarculus sandiegensis]